MDEIPTYLLDSRLVLSSCLLLKMTERYHGVLSHAHLCFRLPSIFDGPGAALFVFAVALLQHWRVTGNTFDGPSKISFM